MNIITTRYKATFYIFSLIKLTFDKVKNSNIAFIRVHQYIAFNNYSAIIHKKVALKLFFLKLINLLIIYIGYTNT